MSPRESTQLPWPGPRQSKRASTFPEASRTLTRAEESLDAALADVQHALAVHGDVHGPLDVVPDGHELTVQGEELHPVILPVTEEDRVVVDQEAVGKVEVPRALPQ